MVNRLPLPPVSTRRSFARDDGRASSKIAPAGHSRASGNAARSGLTWAPACAGVTKAVTLISLHVPQARVHSA